MPKHHHSIFLFHSSREQSTRVTGTWPVSRFICGSRLAWKLRTRKWRILRKSSKLKMGFTCCQTQAFHRYLAILKHKQSNTNKVINDDSDTFVAFCPMWSVSCQRLARPWSDLGNSLAREDDEVE